MFQSKNCSEQWYKQGKGYEAVASVWPVLKTFTMLEKKVQLAQNQFRSQLDWGGMTKFTFKVLVYL